MVGASASSAGKPTGLRRNASHSAGARCSEKGRRYTGERGGAHPVRGKGRAHPQSFDNTNLLSSLTVRTPGV